MATEAQDKEESGQGSTTGQGSKKPEGLTIILPSIADLPPLPPVQLEPKRVLWLGGLAMMGVIGVLQWPVVAAVGVGSYVAERLARAEIRAEFQKDQSNKQ